MGATATGDDHSGPGKGNSPASEGKFEPDNEQAGRQRRPACSLSGDGSALKLQETSLFLGLLGNPEGDDAILKGGLSPLRIDLDRKA